MWNCNNETIGIFEFPKHVIDPEKCSRWIAHVLRENWYLSKTQKLHLCENHFRPEDVITKSTDSNNRRKQKKGSDSLKQKRLKADALPCIWPGAPHRSKLISPRPTSLSSSESRLEKTCGIQTSVTRDFILFFQLCYKDIPKIQYSIKVASDLTVTIYLQGVQVKRLLVSEIASTNLNTCTTLNELFSYLEAQPVQDITQGDILEDVIEKLKDPKFEENVKIDFIVEQLTLAFKSPNGRRYSPSLLAMSALLQRMSPTSYKQMYSDGFLTLPSPIISVAYAQLLT